MACAGLSPSAEVRGDGRAQAMASTAAIAATPTASQAA